VTVVDSDQGVIAVHQRRSHLERAFAVLSAFRGRQTLTLADVTRRAALPKTTVHRLVHEMVELGVLSTDGRSYGVGLRMFEIATSAQRTELRDASVPALHHLAQLTGRTVGVAILDGTDAVFLERVVGKGDAGSLRFSQPGLRVPAHACAAGKVLLAFSPEDTLVELTSRPLARLGPGTVTVPSELRRQLDTICRTKVAIEEGDSGLGVVAIAVPIPDMVQRSGVCGAVTAKGPFPDVEQTAAALRKIGIAIGNHVASVHLRGGGSRATTSQGYAR
jgi:IclR family acetate operon transcriptional repressor